MLETAWQRSWGTRIQLEMEYIPQGFVEKFANLFLTVRMRVRRGLRLYKHFIELRCDETGAWRGEIEGDGALFDVDATFLLTDSVAIVFGANSRQRDQQGDFTFGPDRNLGEWDVSTTGLDAGLEWAATNERVATGSNRCSTATPANSQSCCRHGSLTIAAGAVFEIRNDAGLLHSGFGSAGSGSGSAAPVERAAPPGPDLPNAPARCRGRCSRRSTAAAPAPAPGG